jgi:ATP-dependent HslUV protease subunit HslV
MQTSDQPPVWHGTTILTVRKGGKVVIGGDGQVSIGQTVIKSNARKVCKSARCPRGAILACSASVIQS